jgi:transglutaminase-like putative cysteine protease
MKRFVLLCLTIFSFFLPHTVFASDFTADYDIDYAVSPNGLTIVTQKVSLTNNKTNLYPKQYAITIDTDNIRNVIAYDNKGMITPSIIQNKGKTEITLKFNEQIVGMGKVLSFELRYEQSDIAEKHGNIWEVNIPGIEDDPTIGTYTVSLRTPANFGDNAYMKPLPASGRKWVKHQMIQGGISVAYGTKQEFTSEIYYDIENTKLTDALYEIALPPDTAFQKIQILSIEPKPKETKLDADGNWIATYQLAGSQKLRVLAKLAIATYIKPRNDFKPTAIIPSDYTRAQPFWDTEDPVIKKLITQYKTPREIFDFVSSTLSYNYERTKEPFKRYGSREVLKNPKDALCSEFTDLFIALARAAGIPAREAVGYAYTTNSKLRPITVYGDILHSWPEYYDETQNLWIPVDPTWTRTTKGIDYFDTLDFNHIAFVLHGVASDYPYPAGSFKQGSIPKKNITVAFAEKSMKEQKQTLATTISIPKKVTLGSTLTGTVTVQNTSVASINDVMVFIHAEPFLFETTKKESYIPPYGTITIPISIQTSGLFSNEKGKITVTTNGDITTEYFDFNPQYRLIIPGIMVLIGFLLFLWTLFKKH